MVLRETMMLGNTNDALRNYDAREDWSLGILMVLSGTMTLENNNGVP